MGDCTISRVLVTCGWDPGLPVKAGPPSKGSAAWRWDAQTGVRLPASRSQPLSSLAAARTRDGLPVPAAFSVIKVTVTSLACAW